MKSIRDLYKIGKGPSSSHTMGPERAARIFKQEHPDAERYEVTLYGSLALTGVGHGTDRVLSEVLSPTPTEIIFSDKDPDDLKHPNTLDFAAYKGEEKIASMRVESIGGGDIVIEGREVAGAEELYPENSFAEIAQYCRWRYISLREYVELNEGPEIWDFLQQIWRAMRSEVEEGLEATGILPGGLGGVRSIRGCEPVLCAAREMAQAGKWVAAICAAPTVLAELGLLEGRRATCYPGMEPEMRGAVMQNAGVVRDGNFITGRAAGSAFAFGLALVEALCGAETAARIAAQVVWNGEEASHD